MSDDTTIKPVRLYTIQNDRYYYYTGRLSNGNQVLMLGDGDGKEIETPEFPRVEFDTNGNLLAVYNEETEYKSSDSLIFTPGTILAKLFLIPELWIGIKDLPDHYQDSLDDPESVSEDERLDYADKIESWRKSGEFVLWFNEDYFLSEEGELESS